MRTAGDVFAAVRALVDDPEGDYATDESQAPLLQIAVETLENELFANPNIGNFKTTVVLPAVAQGTTSLSALFAAGGLLESLTEILSMREKKAGDPDASYVWMYKQDDLPTTTQTTLNQYFSFTGDDVKLPGATQDTDIRIYGEFKPATIQDKDTRLAPGTSPYFKYKTAALVARAHGSRDLASDYENQAQVALESIFNRIIMEQQLIPTRMIGFGDGSDSSFGGR